jgi:uncharacterized integral membrane protein
VRILAWLVVVFVAATVFALSNSAAVPIMFWRWTIYTGPLSLALVASGLIGALLTFAASLMLQAGLRERLRELDEKVREQGEKLGRLPTWAQPRGTPKPPSAPPEDTRQIP